MSKVILLVDGHGNPLNTVKQPSQKRDTLTDGKGEASTASSLSNKRRNVVLLVGSRVYLALAIHACLLYAQRR